MKDSMESPEEYVVSLLKIISQKNPQLAGQIAEDLKRCWKEMKKEERISLVFLKTAHVLVSGAFQNMALDLRKEQDWPGLIAHCEHWLEIEPAKDLACYNIAVGFKEMCCFQEAIQACLAVIGRNPEHPLAWLDLGEIYGLMGRNGESVEAYLEVLRLMPDDGRSWYSLYIAYKEQGRIEEAEEARQKAKHFETDEVALCYNAGVRQILIGNIAAAYAEFMELMERDQTRAHKLLDKIINEG